MSPFNEYSGLISFGIDRLDLLEVQVTQESSPIPQFKSISVLALSFLYTPTLTSISHLTSNSSHPGKVILGGSEGKCLPTVWQTRVRPLDWEDPLEKEMTTPNSILAQKIPWIEEPSRLHETIKIQT